MGQILGETLWISAINSILILAGWVPLRTLPIINCASKQVRINCSIDERLRSESAYFRSLHSEWTITIIYCVTLVTLYTKWKQLDSNQWSFDYQSNALPTKLCFQGGSSETRTHDLQVKSPLLYQLSYWPIYGQGGIWTPVGRASGFTVHLH